jgi:predicted kinase
MKKFMIIIEGPMGSGKTTVGKLLHPQLPRTAMLGIDRIKFFLSDFERGERDNTISDAVVREMCKEYIRRGINILIPQGFWKKEYIEPYLKLAEESGLQTFVYQLTAPREVLLERIHARPKPELAKTPVPEERILKNLHSWEDNRYELGKILDTTSLTSDEIVQIILKDISEEQKDDLDAPAVL